MAAGRKNMGNPEVFRVLVEDCRCNKDAQDQVCLRWLGSGSVHQLASVQSVINLCTILAFQLRAASPVSLQSGMTALHHATLCNNMRAVRTLVHECKADPDVVDYVCKMFVGSDHCIVYMYPITQTHAQASTNWHNTQVRSRICAQTRSLTERGIIWCTFIHTYVSTG